MQPFHEVERLQVGALRAQAFLGSSICATRRSGSSSLPRHPMIRHPFDAAPLMMAKLGSGMKGDLSDRMNSRFTLRGKDKLNEDKNGSFTVLPAPPARTAGSTHVTTQPPNTSSGTDNGKSCGVRTASVIADVTASSQMTPPQALVQPQADRRGGIDHREVDDADWRPKGSASKGGPPARRRGWSPRRRRS